MSKYGVTHRLSTAYHPKISGQVKVTNRRLKRNLKMTVGENRALWSDKLEDALWAFRTAFKTPVGCTPYRIFPPVIEVFLCWIFVRFPRSSYPLIDSSLGKERFGKKMKCHRILSKFGKFSTFGASISWDRSRAQKETNCNTPKLGHSGNTGPGRVTS
nr:reverse transcriptase domain-containing protein [Tanacetum cinerariifolium]